MTPRIALTFLSLTLSVLVAIPVQIGALNSPVPTDSPLPIPNPATYVFDKTPSPRVTLVKQPRTPVPPIPSVKQTITPKPDHTEPQPTVYSDQAIQAAQYLACVMAVRAWFLDPTVCTR